ncbi:hypothetical protein P3L10_014222 [Capsicum annuum]
MANNSVFSNELIYGDTRLETMSIKFISLLLCFMLALSCFVQSSRFFIHANYLISTPVTDIPVSYVELAVIREVIFGMIFLLHYFDKNTKQLHRHRSSINGKKPYEIVEGPSSSKVPIERMVFLLHYFYKNMKQLHRHRLSVKGKKPYEMFEGPSSRKVPIESIVM